MNLLNLLPPFSGTSIILYLFLSIIFFLGVREILTWYWKINKITSLLEEIKENTKKATSGTSTMEEPKRSWPNT